MEMFYFDELSDTAKANAIANVTASYAVFYTEEVNKAREAFKADMNCAINDDNHILRVRNSMHSVNRFKANVIDTIRWNHLCFTANGSYVYYIDKIEMIVDGKVIVPDNQEEMRNDYIAINNRGIEYHRELAIQLRK